MIRKPSVQEARNFARSVRVRVRATKKKPRPTLLLRDDDDKIYLPPSHRAPLLAPPPAPTAATSAALFLVGALLGPPLDGIHGAFHLLEYDVAPISLGDETGALHTSLLVPALLGTFYAVSGALQLLGDRLSFYSSYGSTHEDDEGRRRRRRERKSSMSDSKKQKATKTPSFSLALCALAAVVAHLSLSALLYNNSASFPTSSSQAQISFVLYPTAFLVWLFLDGTATGLAVAALTAVAAPLAELALMNAVGVWHYPRADFFLPFSSFLPPFPWSLEGEKATRGIVSWVPACYFAYSCWIGALARAWRQEGR